jgi:chemotaxis protein MotB
VPFVDLLAGTVAVLILFFLGLKFQEAKRERLAQAGIESTLKEIQRNLERAGKQNGIVFKNDRMRLPDGSFESLSARPSDLCREQLRVVSQILVHQLRDQPRLRILIEGHTDSLPMSLPHLTPDGAFNDNYSLSAARANSARRLLISDWAAEDHGRVGIAGYGPDRPLQGCKPEDPLNRRVEIRLEIQKDL